MWTRTPLFDQQIRAGGTAICQVDVYDNAGTLLQSEIPISVDSGQSYVTVDTSNPGVRRTLTLELVPGVLEAVVQPGAAVLKAYRGVRYTDGTTELIPLGVFEIDTETVGYAATTNNGATNTIQITCPDHWASVQGARFEAPEITNGSNITEALRLMQGAFGTPPTIAENSATSTLTTVQAVWPLDRDQAILSLLSAAGAEAFFDNVGNIVCRDLPKLTEEPVWTADSGQTGVLVDATRTRTRATTYNVVIVAAVMANGAELFDPITVEDDDPTSPTYIGTYGRRPYFVSTATVTTEAQATAYGQSVLALVTAKAAQKTMDTVVHPCLDGGDTIDVVLPDGSIERDLIQTVTIPLDVDTAQTITTTSTQPTLPAEA